MIQINRREFLASLTIETTTTTVLLGGEMATPETNNRSTQAKSYPLFVSTWAFGKATNNEALQNYQRGKSLLDVVEASIRIAEADVSNASVGIGGIPNADGIVQLDACIMEGPDHRVGSVAAIENIAHPNFCRTKGDGENATCHVSQRRSSEIRTRSRISEYKLIDPNPPRRVEDLAKER